jgi:hypothetical protein
MFKRKNTRKKKIVLGSLVFVVVLLAIRMSLPWAIEWQINRTLKDHQTYAGRVESVSLSIIRPTLILHELHIHHKEDPKILSALVHRIEIRTFWKSLFEEAWRLQTKVSGAEIVGEASALIEDEKEARAEEESEAFDWQRDLPAFLMESLIVYDAKIEMKYEYKTALQSFKVSGLFVSLKNLANWQHAERATLEFWAIVDPTGNLHGKLTFDLLSSPPVFDLALYTERLSLVSMNPIVEEIAKFDFEAGHINLYVELKSANGSYSGYVKPILRDVEIFSEEDVEEKGLGAVWNVVAEFVKNLFENPSKEQVATEIPIRGEWDDPKIKLGTAIRRAITNAFIQALTSDFRSPPPEPNL